MPLREMTRVSIVVETVWIDEDGDTVDSCDGDVPWEWVGDYTSPDEAHRVVSEMLEPFVTERLDANRLNFATEETPE